MARTYNGPGRPPVDKDTLTASQLHQEFDEPCGHNKSTSPWLVASQSKACPVCVVTRVTTAIKDVQRKFIDRGGIFMSRSDDQLKLCDHKTLAVTWRTAKLHGLKAIETVELLISQEVGNDEDKLLLEQALALWESESLKTWKVPGHSYDGEEEEMSEQEIETLRLMMVLLEKTVMKLATELEEEDKRAGKPEPFRLDLKSRHTMLSRQKTSSPTKPSALDRPTTSTSPLPLRFPLSSTSPKTLTPTRSILKRKSPSPESSPSPSDQPRKRVQTASFATVCSDDLTTTNPSPFEKPTPESTQTTVQEHRSCTLSESKVSKRTFWRPSMYYTPGKWVSPAFYEKANTSLYKMTWDEAEEIMRSEVTEWEEEKQMVGGLKKISGAWIMRWWLGNVVGKVDLEKMRDSMDDQMVGG
jgi:hypothetical protein